MTAVPTQEHMVSLLRMLEESKLCSAKQSASELLGALDCDRGLHCVVSLLRLSEGSKPCSAKNWQGASKMSPTSPCCAA